MTILLSRIAPRGQPVDVHAPLGEIEWQRTIKHIEATLPASVPVYNPAAVGMHNTCCSAPGSLDTSLSHAAGLIEIAACHA